ncbi:MAG: biotin--[acetyl-CoA-carboxylase] ligase [Acidobacteria bacterium]|nr:biotin--[acetyl-CoA-carboxylase] ligase [Acidobacteriota bacterium]
MIELLPLLGTDFRSGTELARELGVSRVAVWKRIQRLREMGYPVEAHPKRGYRLVEEAPAPGVLAARLPRRPAGSYRYLGVTASTQEDLRRWAAHGAPSGALVVAEGQTAGRGRRGRRWQSPPSKGLYCSVLLRGLPVGKLPLLGLAGGVALAEATGVGRVKWPNDILGPDGAKVGGVLMEAQTNGEEAHVVILGLGVNLEPADLPDHAAALSRYSRVSRTDLLVAFVQRLEHWLDRLDRPGEVLAAWRRRDVTLGHQVRVRTRQGVVEGRAVGVRTDGTFVVRPMSGEEVAVAAGDVELVGQIRTMS